MYHELSVPLVSIIITSYNYGRYLADAINSALAQTYEKTEVIVVDDGSTDNSRGIIASYGERVIPVLKDNGGQASAFNAGFAVSKGDIVIFLDSDDELAPNVVEEIMELWHPGISKVHYRLQWIDAQGNPLNICNPSAEVPLPSGDLKQKVVRQGYYCTPPTSGNAFSRKFLQAVMPVPETEWRVCTDGYLHLHAPLYGDIEAIQAHLGYYRVHGSNASSAFISESDRERLVREISLMNMRKSLLLKALNGEDLKAVTDPAIVIARKLALLLICPDDNLVRKERIGKLALRGLRAIWRESDIPIWKQIVVSIYFISAPFMPHDLAKDLSLCYIYPEKRPSLIRRLSWMF